MFSTGVLWLPLGELQNVFRGSRVEVFTKHQNMLKSAYLFEKLKSRLVLGSPYPFPSCVLVPNCSVTPGCSAFRSHKTYHCECLAICHWLPIHTSGRFEQN